MYSNGADTKVLVFNTQGVYSLDTGTGSTAWFYPWNTKVAPPVADPLFFMQKVFLSTSEKNPVGELIDISGPEPQKLWDSPDLATHISSSVYLGGYIYGIHGDYHSHIRECSLRCIDAESSELMWESDPMIGGPIIGVDDKLIVLDAPGPFAS